MTSLSGQTSLVLGGSRGIGAAIVQALAKAGSDTTFTYLSSADTANALAEETGARAVKSDGADRDATGEVIKNAGPLDILVISAGLSLGGDPLETDAADIDRMIDLNFRTPYFAVVEAARQMSDGGRIIIIGSTMADTMPFPGMAAYSATKSALRGMVRGFARDFGPRGITINVIEPGPVDTDSNPADGPDAEHIKSMMPLGRYINASEIGDFVTFLADPRTRSITGSSHKIDAGFGL